MTLSKRFAFPITDRSSKAFKVERFIRRGPRPGVRWSGYVRSLPMAFLRKVNRPKWDDIVFRRVQRQAVEWAARNG